MMLVNKIELQDVIFSIYYTTMRGDSLYGFCFDNVYTHVHDEENDDDGNDVVIMYTCDMRISVGVRYYTYRFQLRG